MKNVVISGSGVFTPEERISNDELVQSFNQYVDNYNTEHAAAIAEGTITALEYSSSEFIEKASGIKSRYVLYKEGILDPAVMHPKLTRRGEDALPEMWKRIG